MVKSKTLLSPVLVVMLLIFTISFHSCSCNTENIDRHTKKKDTESVPKDKALVKANYNVFIENSASMDGYVEGEGFGTSIFSLLNNLNDSDLADTIKLNYINNQPINFSPNADDLKIKEFIYRLSKEEFKNRGKQRGSSEFYDMFDKVLSSVNEINVSILISDCIFYPSHPKHNCVTPDALYQQQSGITSVFRKKLKDLDMSVIVLQMLSQFNGIYYDYCNKPIPTNKKPPYLEIERPYYIWVIGKTDQIKALVAEHTIENIIGHYKQKIIFSKNIIPSTPKINIARKADVGSHSVSDNEIIEAKKEGNLYGFSIAANYSNGLFDRSYFTDELVFEILANSKYTYQVDSINPNSQDGENGYTHRIKFETNDLKNEKRFKIDAKVIIPSWVNNATSPDDSNIKIDTAQHLKTFGLSYIIKGVYDAFYPPGQSQNVIFSNTITIKR